MLFTNVYSLSSPTASLFLFGQNGNPIVYPGLAFGIRLPAWEGLAVPSLSRAICTGWTGAEWNQTICSTTIVSKINAICVCQDASDVAIFAQEIQYSTHTITTPINATSAIQVTNSSVSPFLSTDLIFLIFVVILGFFLIIVALIFLARRKSVAATQQKDTPTENKADLNETLEELQEEFSEDDDVRNFSFGEETSLESDDDKRDFSVGLDDDEEDRADAQKVKKGIYDSNATTLPPPKIVDKSIHSTRSLSRVLKAPTRQRPMIRSFHPTAKTTATPLSTAALVRTLSSARKLTQ